MPDIRLSQDAEYLLCELYSEYRLRRKNGMTSKKAKIFGGNTSIQAELMPLWPTDDIDEAARELSRKGLITCFFADDILYADCVLSNEGITYMEHRFGDKLDKLTQRISALRSLVNRRFPNRLLIGPLLRVATLGRGLCLTATG